MQKSSGNRRSFLCEYGYMIWGAARGSVETETLTLLRTPKNFWERGIQFNITKLQESLFSCIYSKAKLRFVLIFK